MSALATVDVVFLVVFAVAGDPFFKANGGLKPTEFGSK